MHDAPVKMPPAARPSRKATLLAALALAVTGAAVIGGAMLLRGRPWLAGAIGSKDFLTLAGIFFGCAALLAALAGAMWKMGAANRFRKDRGEEGVVALEFMMILPIMLMVVLIMIQSSMLMGGNLCVHYAAFCAARSAVVQIPKAYENEPANEMGPAETSLKMSKITQAAVYAVMPVSCGDDVMGNPVVPLQASLRTFLAASGQILPNRVDELIGRKWNYATQCTGVQVAPPANGPSYGEAEEIVVNLQHTFYLSVPYARRLFAVGADGVKLNLPQQGAGSEYGTIIRATCRLSNEGVQDYIDVEPFPRPNPGG